jgi:hypothetical protein
MQIGLVRVDSFKRFASVLKKRIEGCKHTIALERLARSCGMKGYLQLLEDSAHRCTGSPLVQGSSEELLADWKQRLGAEFSIDVDAVLSPDELEQWFGKVFVTREHLVVDRDDGCETVRHVVDPRLGEANWRDSEFRQWIQREVDRDKGPRTAEFLDDEVVDGEVRATSRSRRSFAQGSCPGVDLGASAIQRTAVCGGTHE